MTRSIWTIPVLLAALTCVGLVSGLLGDGAEDWLAWLGLAAPVAAAMWALRVQRS